MFKNNKHGKHIELIIRPRLPIYLLQMFLHNLFFFLHARDGRIFVDDRVDFDPLVHRDDRAIHLLILAFLHHFDVVPRVVALVLEDAAEGHFVHWAELLEMRADGRLVELVAVFDAADVDRVVLDRFDFCEGFYQLCGHLREDEHPGHEDEGVGYVGVDYQLLCPGVELGFAVFYVVVVYSLLIG